MSIRARIMGALIAALLTVATATAASANPAPTNVTVNGVTLTIVAGFPDGWAEIFADAFTGFINAFPTKAACLTDLPVIPVPDIAAGCSARLDPRRYLVLAYDTVYGSERELICPKCLMKEALDG